MRPNTVNAAIAPESSFPGIPEREALNCEGIKLWMSREERAGREA